MPSRPFKPDYAPSPGRMLDENLEYYGMSVAEFAGRCGRPVEYVQKLLSGAAPLDSQTAQHIAKEFGGAAETWLGIEREYRQKLAQDTQNRVRREAIWGRILYLPRILSRASRSLGRNRRSMPRQS